MEVVLNGARDDQSPGRFYKEFMSRRKHNIYLALGWLLIFFLLTPPTNAIGARVKKAQSSKPVVYPNSSITILVDRNYLPALKDAIAKAKKEITLSFFHFKTKGSKGSYPDVIMASLIAASQRGVKVMVLLEQGRNPDEDNTRENRQTMERLRKMGVIVHLDSPLTTTHTKMAVIDGKYTFIGSHNMTQSALKYNNEISVLIESPQVAAEALGYIESLIPR
jgi:phosphatidylserine/phosphatidylglycerophosphate/cardiolipin synthase-like enzyme